MKNTKKQQKYDVFTTSKLKALVKMSEAQDGVIVVRFESSNPKLYPGQICLTDKFYDQVLEYWDD